MSSQSHREAAPWAGLIRDHRYFSGLARAVEGRLRSASSTVLDDRWGAFG